MFRSIGKKRRFPWLEMSSYSSILIQAWRLAAHDLGIEIALLGPTGVVETGVRP